MRPEYPYLKGKEAFIRKINTLGSNLNTLITRAEKDEGKYILIYSDVVWEIAEAEAVIAEQELLLYDN